MLGHLRGWHPQTSENSKRISLESYKATRDKTLSRIPYQRNEYLGSTLVRYSGAFLKWTRDELKRMDQRTRKLMTMHKALHTRDKVVRLYVSRKKRGRGFTSIEDNVDTSIQRHENCIEKHEQRLITTITHNTHNMIDNGMTITWEQKLEKKSMGGLNH